MKTAALLLALAATLLAAPKLARADGPGPCGRGWVYFDIGNTLINTSDWDHLKYMPQARDYLLGLKAAGFHLAVISNVPDTWGPTVEAKLAYMKDLIAKSWSDTDPFVWDVFETILLPPSDALRKPAPFLFLQARNSQPGCHIAFEGKDPIEVRAAVAAGFDRGYATGKTTPGEFFLPADQIFQSP